MQRTVQFTKFTYAENTLVDGSLEAQLKTVEVMETDEKKAYSKAVKIVGYKFIKLAVETFSKLYKMDDETFFKYATEVKSEVE